MRSALCGVTNILLALGLGRSNLSAMEEEFYDLSSFAVDDPDMEGLSLLDTVRKVKPNILIGEN